MSLDITKSLELQRRVLGEPKEVRICRFDTEEKLVSHSAGSGSGEVVTYNRKVLTPEQQLELQQKILERS